MQQIKEIYAEFLTHLPNILLGAGWLIFTVFLAILIRRIVVKRIKPKTKNPLLVSFIGKIIALTINVLGIILFLSIVGLGDISSKLLAGAGIITFVIGFAFKDIGENFLSGVLLAFKSPFGINDLIETENITGYVTEVNLRETVIKTLDGKDVFIPNSQILKNPLINYTVDGFLRYDFIVGLDYESDVNKAIAIIHEKLSEIKEVLHDKKPVVVIDDLMASTINLRIFFWIDTLSSKSKSYHNQIRSHVINDVLIALTKQGFYMPADIIEVKNHNSSTFK